jgi:hypothetical protein
MSETNLITHQFILHRVLQWGIEEYLYALSLNKAHFDDTFAEASMATDFYNNPLITRFQFRECHILSLFACKIRKKNPHDVILSKKYLKKMMNELKRFS